MTLFIGQSHGNIIKYNSENIFIVLKKKKKLLKLLSFNKKEITYLAYLIKKLRPISKYKNKGIKYEYEIIKFKQGKAKQR
jgi:ribosomal protein L6P/L9E